MEPSGEKRGIRSGPSVSGASPPEASCLSQIRGLPSRLEVKAIIRPSGEALGSLSRPETVSTRTRAGSVTSGRRSAVESAKPATAPSIAKTAAASQPIRRRGAALPSAASAAHGPLPVVVELSMANARSRADWKRRSGIFSRQRRTTRSRAGVTAPADGSNSAGSSRRMAVMVSGAVSRWKARCPWSISKSTQPSEKMSER